MKRYAKVAVTIDEFINGGRPDGFYACLAVAREDAVLGFGDTADSAFADLLSKIGGEEVSHG